MCRHDINVHLHSIRISVFKDVLMKCNNRRSGCYKNSYNWKPFRIQTSYKLLRWFLLNVMLFISRLWYYSNNQRDAKWKSGIQQNHVNMIIPFVVYTDLEWLPRFLPQRSLLCFQPRWEVKKLDSTWKFTDSLDISWMVCFECLRCFFFLILEMQWRKTWYEGQASIEQQNYVWCFGMFSALFS